MKFTVIVACYQSAEYIPGCIRSIRAQPGDWECVFRTERSTDGSAEIARREIGGDPRFLALEGDPSGGPGASRNAGIERARGDYVLFLDVDDELAPDAFLRLEPLLVSRPDVAALAIDWDGRVRDPWAMVDRTVTGVEATVMQARAEPFPLAMSQQFVCRTDFLRANSLRFISGFYHEDEEFLPRLLRPAKSFVATHLPLYRYIIREGSMMTATKARHVVSVAKVMRSHFRLLAGNDPCRDLVRAWSRTWLTMFFYACFHPKYAAATPAAKTREALRLMLADDGAAGFDRLLRYASRPRRIGGRFVKFSARTGILWPTKLFFSLYYRMVERRR